MKNIYLPGSALTFKNYRCFVKRQKSASFWKLTCKQSGK